jgi:hypothetical protein
MFGKVVLDGEFAYDTLEDRSVRINQHSYTDWGHAYSLGLQVSTSEAVMVLVAVKGETARVNGLHHFSGEPALSRLR